MRHLTTRGARAAFVTKAGLTTLSISLAAHRDHDAIIAISGTRAAGALAIPFEVGIAVATFDEGPLEAALAVANHARGMEDRCAIAPVGIDEVAGWIIGGGGEAGVAVMPGLKDGLVIGQHPEVAAKPPAVDVALPAIEGVQSMVHRRHPITSINIVS